MRGFRDRVDFRLGAIEQLMKERERETRRKEPIQFNINMIETKLVYMHEKCINV